MSGRGARFLRLATLMVFVAAAVLFARLFTGSETRVSTPEPGRGEIGVAQAIAVAGTDPLAVRGYVFKGPGGLGLRLCDGKQGGSPPRCRGPFVDLYRIDEGSFGLKTGQTDDGEVQYVPEPLAIRGTIVGTAMTVSEVLQ